MKRLDCILLIDDDAHSNYIHSRIIELAEIPAHIQVTTNGFEALEYLTGTGRYAGDEDYRWPALIFLDINMPRMSGWGFLEAYRKLPEDQKAKIVVVMVTTSVDPADKERAEANKDIVTYLNKPLSVESVKKVVADYFQE